MGQALAGVFALAKACFLLYIVPRLKPWVSIIQLSSTSQIRLHPFIHFFFTHIHRYERLAYYFLVQFYVAFADSVYPFITHGRHGLSLLTHEVVFNKPL